MRDSHGRSRGAILVAITLVVTVGCTRVEKRVLERPSCEVCHSPLNDEGKPAGIEEAHPWSPLSCVDCHGGNPNSLNMTEAHVQPSGEVTATRLWNLKSSELDRVSPAYLQFINPGDLRVANKTCGGSDCHTKTVDTVKRSMMAHTSGEVTVARFRAGAQADPYGHLGAKAHVDPDYDASLPSTVTSIGMFDPEKLPPPDEATFGDYQDHYMIKACFRCHVSDFGENKFEADYRSSGCTACHMVYADDGLSKSKDPTLPKETPPHPIRHQLTSAIPTNQCLHCHYRGARVGPSYLGYRESGAPGFNPDHRVVLGQPIHGHDANFYITDEDGRNDVDETLPDIHAERGMHCIDCHTKHDVHGDGHLYSDTLNQIEIRCEDCHGTIDKESDLKTSAGRPFNHLSRDQAGTVWLTGKVDGKKRRVTQVKRSVDPKSKSYSPAAHMAMGRDEKGFTHTDSVECYTCHTDWMPNCYGCHVTLDLSINAAALTTGKMTPGRPSGQRRWVSVHDLILMHGVRGKIAPAMPSERFFLTVKDVERDASGKVVLDTTGQPKEKFLLKDSPRMAADGTPGMGARPVNPHTIRTRARFSACGACHMKKDGSNKAAVEATWGFGSDRYVFTDGTGKKWRQDQLQTKDFKSVVVPGHPEPVPALPLTKKAIERIDKYKVP